MGADSGLPPQEETIVNGSEAEASEDSADNSSAVVSERVKRLFELVPEIGKKWCRWYDLPYVVLSWLLWSWPRRLIPASGRRFLNSGVNFLFAFNQHDRNKVERRDDPRENLVLPAEAKLRQGGLWAVELFPPSKFRTLEESLQRNGWDQSEFRGIDETNVELVKRGREGRGTAWHRLISIATTGTKFLYMGAKREELPAEFEFIELTSVQVGTGLTAVVAFFQFSEFGESCLDTVWRQAHEPTLTWQGLHRPKVVNRYFSAIEATQEERKRLHGIARKWLAQRCPGFFASRSLSSPVLDLNLFEGVNPARVQEQSDVDDGFRALGMPVFFRNLFVSPELPGAVLIPTDGHGPHETLRNCWAIAGEYQAVVNANERAGYGEKPYAPRIIGAMFNGAARSFLLYLSVMHYLSEQRAVYSVARDLAAVRHRVFNIENARRLSSEFVETGLDLHIMARDCQQLWATRWRTWHGIQVKSIPLEGDEPKREEFDLIEAFGTRSKEQFEQLLEEDQNYRTVLSTTAALGASTESAKIGRRALFVAACSMAVAGVTLILTEPGVNSIWAMLADSVSCLFSWFVGFIEWPQSSAQPV